MRFAFPASETTWAASASSPACVACRKLPGGSVTCAGPMATTGALSCATISPCRVSLARRCCAASFASAAVAFASSGPEPRTSTSRPLRRCRELDVQRLVAAASVSAIALGRDERAFEGGGEDRAAVDRHDVARARSGEADLQDAALAFARMHDDAAAALRHARPRVRRLRRRCRLAPACRRRCCVSRRGRRRRASAGSRSRRRR